MIAALRQLYTPGGYHGSGRRAPFFEGWYLKLINADKSHRWAFIPGIVLGEDAHAFVQVLDGSTGAMHYNRFATDDFEAATDRFDVRVGPNRFSRAGLHVALQGPDSRVEGDVRFGALHPWPIRAWSPGAMGPFAFTPRMECLHGVLSLTHELSGLLRLGDETVGFDGGRGYTEKDWGRSFPLGYVWMQSNHFTEQSGRDRPDVSLTLSVARIPYGPVTFRGILAGLLLNGRLHPMTTYTGARLRHLDVSDREVSLRITRPGGELAVEAQRASRGTSLLAPTTAGMTGRVAEAMDARLDVAFRYGGDEVFRGRTEVAALEALNPGPARLLL